MVMLSRADIGGRSGVAVGQWSPCTMQVTSRERPGYVCCAGYEISGIRPSSTAAKEEAKSKHGSGRCHVDGEV